MLTSTCSAEHASGKLIYLSKESLLFHTFTYLLNSFTGKTMYLHHLLPYKLVILFVVVAHSTDISLIAAWSLGKKDRITNAQKTEDIRDVTLI